jgi:hypothetical protein
MQIEGAYITEVIKLKEYVEHTEDPLMQIVRTHQHNTSSTLFHTATNLQKSLQSDMKQIKNTIARNLKERWEVKRLHGQFPQILDEGLIDKEQSYRWLKFGGIKGDTENVIMAAQDQAISANYCYILGFLGNMTSALCCISLVTQQFLLHNNGFVAFP